MCEKRKLISAQFIIIYAYFAYFISHTHEDAKLLEPRSFAKCIFTLVRMQFIIERQRTKTLQNNHYRVIIQLTSISNHHL